MATRRSGLSRRDRDSSLTRVEPAFRALSTLDPTGLRWVGFILQMGSRAAQACLPNDPTWTGPLLQEPDFHHRCIAPLDYLSWLVANPQNLDPKTRKRNREKAKQTGRAGETPRNRENLFACLDSKLEEARQRLRKPGGCKLGPGAWHVLEGSTCVDCVLWCEYVTVFVEGKRTETRLTDSTGWYAKRNQIVRNMECLLAEPRRTERWYMLTIVEAAEVCKPGEGCEASARLFDRDRKAVGAAVPHLDETAVDDLWSHYLGYTTWQQIQSCFGLPAFPDRVGEPSP